MPHLLSIRQQWLVETGADAQSLTSSHSQGEVPGGGSVLSDRHFEEQLQRVREIRLSERKFYQKISDL